MANYWIITPEGEAVNLDYVNKIMWGGDFTTNLKPLNVYLFHAGVPQATGTKGSMTVCVFANEYLAKAFRDRLLFLLKKSLGAFDLQEATASLTGLTPASTTAGIAVVIQLAGTNIIDGGNIIINNISMPVSLVNGLAQFTLDATLPAATYDVIYTDGNGGAATLTNGITLT